MRIAIDCHTLEIDNWAGKEKFLFSVLNQLKKNEEHIFYLYFRKKVFSSNNFPNNFTVININLPTPFWQIAVLFSIYFKRIKVIICPCSYLLSALCFFTNSIVVVHDLTTFIPKINFSHKLMTKLKERLLLGISLKRAERIIAVSENTKNDIIQYFKIPQCKIEVVYLAPCLASPCVNNEKKFFETNRPYNLPEKYILFVGTIEPRKNLASLIRAFHLLRLDIGNCKLVIVGKRGWFYDEIFELVKKLGLENEIIFTGYIADCDLPYFYSNATLFVYPSLYEGFGLPVVEAMAFGCPVITSNRSSLPEVVNGAGFLINPYSVEEIKNAMFSILNNGILQKTLKRKSFDRASFFSWEKTHRQIVNVINNIT